MTEIADTLPPDDVSSPSDKYTCAVSGRPRSRKDLVEIDALRPSLSERIYTDFPDLTPGSFISRAELSRYRQLYVEESLKAEHGDVSQLEQEVAESIANSDTLAENIEAEYSDKRTFGEVMADHVASFGGSWMFIICFAIVMAIWMTYNLLVGEKVAFDSYPFILLNLVLSTLAAIQAPIIMMSQKRQEAKDRLRSFNDFQINLKAELEIRALHEKVDYLMTKQWQRMAEIQQIQLELLQDNKRHNR